MVFRPKLQIYTYMNESSEIVLAKAKEVGKKLFPTSLLKLANDSLTRWFIHHEFWHRKSLVIM